MRTWVRLPVIATFCFAVFAQEPPQNDTADTTGTNKSDRNKMPPTADQAGQAKSDREIMQQIRKSIMDDKSLSTHAHNVKVISRGGKVTLRGPVNSDEEKSQIESKAIEVAGAGNVTNNLTVKAAKTAGYK